MATDGEPKEIRSLLCRERFQLRDLEWRTQTSLRAREKMHQVCLQLSVISNSGGSSTPVRKFVRVRTEIRAKPLR